MRRVDVLDELDNLAELLTELRRETSEGLEPGEVCRQLGQFEGRLSKLWMRIQVEVLTG